MNRDLMTFLHETDRVRSAFIPFEASLKKIYKAMDQTYGKVAARYGFNCQGCEENCCRSRFYHHTYLEYFYLLEGFKTLEPERRFEVRYRAENVTGFRGLAAKECQGEHRMCPLNFSGRCILYVFRPMICRLHGIPHQVQPPGQGITHSPGCDTFMEQCNTNFYHEFDRTPFYIKIAELEKKLRKQAGFEKKIKMTVAQMLIHFSF